MTKQVFSIYILCSILLSKFLNLRQTLVFQPLSMPLFNMQMKNKSKIKRLFEIIVHHINGQYIRRYQCQLHNNITLSLPFDSYKIYNRILFTVLRHIITMRYFAFYENMKIKTCIKQIDVEKCSALLKSSEKRFFLFFA